MQRHDTRIVKKARILRRRGFSYKEISQELQVAIPKATMAFWVRDVVCPRRVLAARRQKQLAHLTQARARSAMVRSIQRTVWLEQLDKKHAALPALVKETEIAKALLGTLYLAEGSKGKRSMLTFGNSDPRIVELFLRLLRSSYSIEESKFRCTIQGRADQDFGKLLEHWSKITHIPSNQFYAPRIDSRSIGKPSKKQEYKGVCRIDYLSAELFNEIASIGRVLTR